jgi:hypothetical protein
MELSGHPMKLLVVIAEAVLEARLIADARGFGAQGYTVGEVRGGGALGDYQGVWEADRTIRLEVVCRPTVADEIARHVLATYASHHRLVLYLSDVQVLRPQKF